MKINQGYKDEEKTGFNPGQSCTPDCNTIILTSAYKSIGHSEFFGVNAYYAQATSRIWIEDLMQNRKPWKGAGYRHIATTRVTSRFVHKLCIKNWKEFCA
jgi:hypothetical protein